ncbi:hypothetical protein SteCoe_29283 [Stentor coeruleus]|uniref:EF-hand domain-containing protein n=1 Tax=Stentor coeruleus TaxID=5963 RepID=A0A1R2B691_9CILI|nr:hypothetical protein SteCoe_29283 [Stentor coeruleus]
MSSEVIISIENPKYFKGLFSLAGALYTKTKSSHSMINSGFAIVEPFINPVANALVYYTEPALTKIDISVSSIIQISSKKIESAELTFNERKAFYKASMKAWTSQNHKNFSEFLESLKSFYPSNWTDSIEDYALDFYSKSLDYKKPSQMLSLASDLLGEGSDNIKGIFHTAWKNTKQAWKDTKIVNFTEYLPNVKEQVGDMWNDKLKENAEIFLSLSKLKGKIIDKSNFSEDWKLKAKGVAENTSILILAGADELYFWSKEKFDNSYPMIYKSLNVRLPIKIAVKNFYNRLSEIDTAKLGELTWPEDLKEKMAPAISKIGIENWINNYWSKIDKDEDGIVKIKDLYMVIAVISSSLYEMAKDQVKKIAGNA